MMDEMKIWKRAKLSEYSGEELEIINSDPKHKTTFDNIGG
jgi:hypothetical protein